MHYADAKCESVYTAGLLRFVTDHSKFTRIFSFQILTYFAFTPYEMKKGILTRWQNAAKPSLFAFVFPFPSMTEQSMVSDADNVISAPLSNKSCPTNETDSL